MESVESILLYWFGEHKTVTEISNQKSALWWSKDEIIDHEITDRFQSITIQIAEGKLDHWQGYPKGLLASIICLDQFPRNMYRGLPDSFTYDHQARRMARTMVDNGWNQKLTPINRIFAYLPFEHSETLSDQKTFIALCKAAREVVAIEDRPAFEDYYQYGLKHYQVIEKFGRFPHRNKILGRESSKAEVEFLSQPGSSF